MAKALLKQIGISSILILSGAVVGLLLLILVHYIPIEPMREHIHHSMNMIEKEFEDSVKVDGYPGSLSGVFTDCLMLHYAVYENEEHSLLEQVVHMYRTESNLGEEWQPGISLRDYLNNVPQTKEVEYSRYWHGYLIILKPLLFLTSLNSIRVFSSIVQLLLVGLAVIEFERKGESFLGKAFLLSIPFFYYFSMYHSLSLSICFDLMILLILLQLRLHDILLLNKLWYGYFFLIAGMLTVYFDFLTYPLITLGFPLCVYLYLERENTRKKWLE